MPDSKPSSKAEWLRQINYHPELLGGFETLEEVVKCLEELDDLNDLLTKIEAALVAYASFPFSCLNSIQEALEEYRKKHPARE